MLSRATVMPPKVGMAMGIMMSEPRPVEVRMGSRASKVVALVMRQARTRRLPASKTVAWMDSWS
jgi:hypothetical protein